MKKTVSDFFRLTDETDHIQKVFYLKLSEEEVMRNCREQDGSPNVFFAALLARAARRYDPASDKTHSARYDEAMAKMPEYAKLLRKRGMTKLKVYEEYLKDSRRGILAAASAASCGRT